MKEDNGGLLEGVIFIKTFLSRKDKTFEFKLPMIRFLYCTDHKVYFMSK